MLIMLLFVGAIDALQNPVTKERLCSMIDEHMKQNMHGGSTN